MQEKLLRISEKTIIVGVDVAKKEHWARITDYRGVDLCKAVKVRNSAEGFEKLMQRVEKIRVQRGAIRLWSAWSRLDTTGSHSAGICSFIRVAPCWWE
jgi:hypothetical protein